MRYELFCVENAAHGDFAHSKNTVKAKPLQYDIPEDTAMARFFMAGTNLLGGTAIIRGRDAEHIKVLRLRPGEDVIICDGQGTDYKCRLVYADKEQAEAEVVEVVPCPAEPGIKVTVHTPITCKRLQGRLPMPQV